MIFFLNSFYTTKLLAFLGFCFIFEELESNLLNEESVNFFYLKIYIYYYQ